MARAARERSGLGAFGPVPRSSPRRAQIVTAAAGLFDRLGYHRASLDDIAQEVGVAKPTLYHYFPSKAAILSDIHEEFIDILLTRQEARLREGLLDTRESILEVMADICELMQTHRGHVRVFFEHHRELPGSVRAHSRRKRDAYFAAVRALFERGNAERVLFCDPQLTALALFGMCNWAYQWYQADGPLETRQIATYFHHVLLDGCGLPVQQTGPVDHVSGLTPREPAVAPTASDAAGATTGRLPVSPGA